MMILRGSIEPFIVREKQKGLYTLFKSKQGDPHSAIFSKTMATAITPFAITSHIAAMTIHVVIKSSFVRRLICSKWKCPLLACCQGSKPIFRSFSDTVCIFSCSSSLWRFYRECLFDCWYKHHAIINYHTRSFRTLPYKVLLYPTLQGHFVPDPTRSFHTYPTRSFRTQPYKVVDSYPTMQGHSYITLQVHSYSSLQIHFLTLQCGFVPYYTRLFRTLPYKVVPYWILEGHFVP